MATIEELESTVASLVAQNDDLRLELDRRDRTYDPDDVTATIYGLTGDFITPEEITEYAWNHPDWFRHGVLTEFGGKRVRLTGAGIKFTWLGAEEVAGQFSGGRR